MPPNLLLHKTLSTLDKQAKPLNDGYPTGLWWYVGHLDRDKPAHRKRLNSEVEWTRAMARKLGRACAAEMRFPGSAQRCDVMVPVLRPEGVRSLPVTLVTGSCPL